MIIIKYNNGSPTLKFHLQVSTSSHDIQQCHESEEKQQYY